MTNEALKELFSTPWALLLIMFGGALVSALKQLIVARRQGTPMTVGAYFAKVETTIMVAAVFTAWLGLLYSDTLNIASALAFGYVSNDGADAVTKDGRSASLSGTEAEPNGQKRPPSEGMSSLSLLVWGCGMLYCLGRIVS